MRFCNVQQEPLIGSFFVPTFDLCALPDTYRCRTHLQRGIVADRQRLTRGQRVAGCVRSRFYWALHVWPMPGLCAEA